VKAGVGCDRKGCHETAGWHPVVLFTREDGSSIRGIVGLNICRKHKRETVAVLDVMNMEELAKLSKALHAVRHQLVWTPLDSAEAKAFDRIANAPKVPPS
jgi:hypothetical protein